MNPACNEVLIELKAHLEQAAGDAFKVRHHRFRDTDGEEAPAVAIQFRGNVPRERQGAQGDVYLEQYWELTVDLVIDWRGQPEVDPGETVPVDYDETGFARGGVILATCLDSLLHDDGTMETLNGTVDEIEYLGEPDDPDAATPTDGNIASRLALVYRTREDRPTVLLRGS